MLRENLRITIAAAATEQSVTLPRFSYRVQAFVRTRSQARMAFAPGLVAGVPVKGQAIGYDNSHDTGELVALDDTVYLASDMPGTIVELFVWHRRNVILDSFSDGFSEEFA